MKGLNDPIGIKSLEPSHNPFIMNPFRFANNWATALTNWFKRKPITINGLAKVADFTDNFDATGGSWAQTGTTVTVDSGTADVVDFVAAVNDVDNRVSRDSGLSLNTSWVIDFDVLEDVTSSSSTNEHPFFSLSDLTGDPHQSTTALSLFVVIEVDAGNIEYYKFAYKSTSGALTEIGTALASINGQINYLRIIRDGNKLTLIIYADSERTEVLGTTNITDSAISAIIGTDIVQFGGDYGSTAKTLDVSIDNLSIWADITTVENIPSQQTATLTDDFSTDTLSTNTSDATYIDWDGVGVLDVICPTSVNTGNGDIGIIDLTSVSDTLSTVDFKLNIISSVAGSTAQCWYGLGDITYTTDPIGNRDFYGLYLERSAGAQNFHVIHTNGTGIAAAGNDATFTQSWADGETYYVRIVRSSATVFKVQLFSDSAYTILIEEQTGGSLTGVDVTRYFTVGSRNSSGGTYGITTEVDDLNFYNNISEVNPTTLTDYPVPIKIIGNADLQRKTAETFDDDMSTPANWTTTGTAVNVVNGTLNSVAGDMDTDDREDQAIGTTLSDTTWTAYFDFKIESIAANRSVIPFAINDGTGDLFTGDGLIFFATDTAGVLSFAFRSILSSATDVTSATSSAINYDQQYYNIIRRTSSTTFDCSVYADKARTLLVETLTITGASSSIGGFDNIAGGYATEFANPAEVATWESDNFKVWDGILNPVDQEVATYEDDFTTDVGYTQTGTLVTIDDVTNFNVKIDSPTDATHYVTYPLGFTLDDEHWVAEADINVTGGSNGGDFMMIGFVAGSSAHQSTSADYIGAFSNHDATTNHAFFIGTKDGASETNSAHTADRADNTTRYIRLTRKSKTEIQLDVFSDSVKSILLETKTLAIASTVGGLTHIHHAGRGASTTTGTLDNLKIWNGISSPNASGRKVVFTDNVTDGSDTEVEYSSEMVSYDPINGDWEGYVRIPSLTTGADTTIQMYYSYLPSANPSYTPEVIILPTADFTDSAFSTGWTQVTGTQIAATGGEIAFTSLVRNAEQVLEKPTGIELSDNGIIFDFKINLASQTGSNGAVFIALTSDATWAFSSPTDGVGFNLHNNAGTLKMRTQSYNAGSGSNGANSTFTPTTATDYFIRIIREGQTVRGFVYSDSARTTLIEELGTVTAISTVTGLSRIQVFSQSAAISDTMTGVIDDISIWNNKNTLDRELSTFDPNYKAVHHLSGNSLDSTVYGNDGTNTAVDWEQQNGSVGLVANGTTTEVNLGSDTSVDDLPIGGMVVNATINPITDGELSAGRIVDKRNTGGWALMTTGESGSFMKLTLQAVTSGTAGDWGTTNAVIPIGEVSQVSLIWNNDSVDNDPIFIINGVKYTVGNGITEVTTPTGTYTSDAGDVLVIGNRDDTLVTFDGFIGEVKISDKTRPSSEAITSYNAEKSDTDMTTAGAEEVQ